MPIKNQTFNTFETDQIIQLNLINCTFKYKLCNKKICSYLGNIVN